MPAALLMANLQANLRSQCAIAVEQPERLLQSVNRLFCENTADNGGIRIAFQALQEVLAKGGPNAEPGYVNGKKDGYTPAQRFFITFGQVWCQNQTEQSARVLAKTPTRIAFPDRRVRPGTYDFTVRLTAPVNTGPPEVLRSKIITFK